MAVLTLECGQVIVSGIQIVFSDQVLRMWPIVQRVLMTLDLY